MLEAGVGKPFLEVDHFAAQAYLTDLIRPHQLPYCILLTAGVN